MPEAGSGISVIHGLGGEHHGGHGRGILQRGARDLDRVDDAAFEHGAEFAQLGVVAVVIGLMLHLVEHHGSLGTGILHDQLQRLFESAADDVDADQLVNGQPFDGVQGPLGAHQSDAAARDNPFFNRGTGGRQGVFHPGPCALSARSRWRLQP